ncbi:efflux RND transporter periplasmic adaptor subunit [Polymorphobacter fuscus]|uniref:Efflux RND transporter periplasmic adaptor subunit n=1 Tax=Sandarakinorhabdus fusca TaxID=1439888 RepID=A0A7C9KWB7_9SPHN|nr:efflux RND transporter periplasmic adaptor subunit [Polymorphobacter fuscus]KAB7647579.1 efflux RND transporter periplasmic adaptor subunit [Polymorphobacter fuscus]MQT16845.1 efflux RND transporter periplasmic adaptor subunit [Polymorphobacter fuscus]NJC09166.1 HlyD family secretion protein [Polymorphobacter fuscus]
MKRRSWIILALVVAAVAAFVLWKRFNPPPVVDPYKTAVVERGDLTEEITANGIINPVRVVSVGTQVSGTVQALYADFNDRVKAGQLLLRLDPALFNSRLQASEAALTNIRATAQLQSANAARAAQLVKQDFISRQDYETALASARSTAAQVAQAEAQIRQDRANLEFSVIRSPVAGVVISRQIDIGQTVAASFNTPTLFQIARDLTQMQIEAAVAEADVAKVKPGQRVDFTVDAYGARQFTGTVDQIRLNPTTQQNVVTYTVIVKAANPDGALLPGMTANANFIVSDRKNVLLVPNAALSFKPEGYKPVRTAGRARPQADLVTLFVLANGQPEARRVRAGASDADNSEILSGPLKVGDVVVTGSNIGAKPAGGLFSGPPGGRRESPNSGGNGKAPAAR